MAAAVAEQVMQENVEMQDEEEQMDTGPVPLQALEGQITGITSGDLKKLIDAGFTTMEAVGRSTKKSLIEVKGIRCVRVARSAHWPAGARAHALYPCLLAAAVSDPDHTRTRT